jgi:hypothetical protein
VRAADGRFQGKARASVTLKARTTSHSGRPWCACQALLVGAHGAGPPRSRLTCARAARQTAVECARLRRAMGVRGPRSRREKGGGGAQRADLSNHECLNVWRCISVAFEHFYYYYCTSRYPTVRLSDFPIIQN